MPTKCGGGGGGGGGDGGRVNGQYKPLQIRRWLMAAVASRITATVFGPALSELLEHIKRRNRF